MQLITVCHGRIYSARVKTNTRRFIEAETSFQRKYVLDLKKINGNVCLTELRVLLQNHTILSKTY